MILYIFIFYLPNFPQWPEVAFNLLYIVEYSTIWNKKSRLITIARLTKYYDSRFF